MRATGYWAVLGWVGETIWLCPEHTEQARAAVEALRVACGSVDGLVPPMLRDLVRPDATSARGAR